MSTLKEIDSPLMTSADCTSCREKQQKLVQKFNTCTSEEEKYLLLIEMGKQNKRLDESWKKEAYLVPGCQSRMYLHSFLKDGKVYFEAESDALISSGLARLLIDVYNGETPEVILTCPPSYLDELGIFAKLTPSRANGLYSIHLRIKQDALQLLLGKGVQ